MADAKFLLIFESNVVTQQPTTFKRIVTSLLPLQDIGFVFRLKPVVIPAHFAVIGAAVGSLFGLGRFLCA